MELEVVVSVRKYFVPWNQSKRSTYKSSSNSEFILLKRKGWNHEKNFELDLKKSKHEVSNLHP